MSRFRTVSSTIFKSRILRLVFAPTSLLIEELSKLLSNAEASVRPNVIAFLNVSSTSSPSQARSLVFARTPTSRERTKPLCKHASRFKMLNNASSLTIVSLRISRSRQKSLETALICTSIEDRHPWLLSALRLLRIRARQTLGASFSTLSIPAATLEYAHISTSTEASKRM